MLAGPDALDPRIPLAAERTLLAWIRTGLALMGFGFVVARFGVLLREVAIAGGRTLESRIDASAAGMALVAAGVALNVWASLRHRRMMRVYLATGRFDALPRGPIAVGIASAVLGGTLLIVLAAALLR